MIRRVGAAQDAFKLMLRERIAPALREIGFRGSGQNFALPSATHWALLGFQRSLHSESSHLKFTVNITVVARDTWDAAHAAHAWIGDRPSANSEPTLRDTELPAFWHKRIGLLMPERNDYWWDLDEGKDVGALAAEVVAAIRDYAVPAMREHMA